MKKPMSKPMINLKNMVMGDMSMMAEKTKAKPKKKSVKPWSSQNHAVKSGKKK